MQLYDMHSHILPGFDDGAKNVEISLIDKDGNYVVHGKSFKNSNFFEYFKSYNEATADQYNQMIRKITGGTELTLPESAVLQGLCEFREKEAQIRDLPSLGSR